MSLLLRSTYYRCLQMKNGPFIAHDGFDTPVADDKDLADAVVVYPETVEGNPLGADRCVRWLLHEPGFHTGKVDFSAHEPIFYFQDEFVTPEITRSHSPVARLQTLWVRDDIYRDAGCEQRTGDCYLVRKGTVHNQAHSPEALCLDDLSHQQIAREFQTRKVFYSYDPYTMYSAYAAACGCDSVIVPPPGMTREQWYEDENKRHGVAFGIEDLPRARATREDALAFMKSEEAAARESVQNFAAYCHEYFAADSDVAGGRNATVLP